MISRQRWWKVTVWAVTAAGYSVRTGMEVSPRGSSSVCEWFLLPYGLILFSSHRSCSEDGSWYMHYEEVNTRQIGLEWTAMGLELPVWSCSITCAGYSCYSLYYASPSRCSCDDFLGFVIWNHIFKATFKIFSLKVLLPEPVISLGPFVFGIGWFYLEDRCSPPFSPLALLASN